MARTGDHDSARERILSAAALLFAESGTLRTGVDALIDAAGVAKATFYRHFPTKDALVAAWLRDPRARWFDRVRANAEEGAASPADVIERFYEAVAEWLETDDYLGCPFLNTSIEIGDGDHPVARQIRDHLAEIRAWLTEQAAAAGHPDPAAVGTALHALVAGSIALGVANRTGAYALVARDAARLILDQSRVGPSLTGRPRN